MNRDRSLVDFRGRIVMVGFGSTGQGTLPLLLRHVVGRDRVLVITPDAVDVDAARAEGVSTLAAALTSENHRALLAPELQPGDLLVNLSVGVSSLRSHRSHPRARRDVPRHIGRALARRLHRPLARAGDAHQLCVARSCARAAPTGAALADRAADARREPGAGIALRQAGAARHRARHRRRERRAAGRPRRLGAPRRASRHPRHSRRRARHAGAPSRASARASSSTPGRSTRSSTRRCSRASSAGAATSATSRKTACATRAAAARRSTCSGPGRARACAAGRRSAARSTAS